MGCGNIPIGLLRLIRPTGEFHTVFLRVVFQMIVTCTRCDTEFKSPHRNTHVCPSCNFVFSGDDPKGEKLAIVSASEFIRQTSGTHRLHEEAASRCSVHADVDAIGACSSCGRQVCYACAVETSNGCFCDACADMSASAQIAEYPPRPISKPHGDAAEGKGAPIARQTPPDATREDGPTHIIPWEHRRRIGRQRALFRTWRRTMLSPIRFFDRVHPGGGYFGPLLYGTVWILLGLAGGLAWRLAAHLYPQAISLFDGESIEILLRLSPASATVAGAVLLAPIVTMFLLAAICVVFHLSVVVFAREHAGFKATLGVVCYSAGACAFYFIPSVGGLIAGVFQLFIVATGFRQAHRISFWRAFAAGLLPCALLLAVGEAYTYWTVAGTPFDALRLIAVLFPSLNG